MRDTKQAPVEWDVVFTPDVWDTFMMMEQQELSSVASRSVKKENASVGEDRPVASNVKVDLKSYPTFDGKLQNWKPFKRQFYAMAQMHSLDYLLSKSIDSLAIDEESEKYKKDNKFLQSALTYALAKSHSISKVEKNDNSGDGKQSWLDLVDWYEGQGSEETIAAKALNVITTHKLNTNTHGGAEAFLERYQQAVLDLENVGEPCGEKMAKLHLLNNIIDKDYEITVENLRMNDTKTYSDVLQEIRRKSILVESTRRNSNRRANNAKKGDPKDQKDKKWVPPHKWHKMSKEEREAHKKKYGTKQGDKKPELPKQYSSSLNAAATEQKKELIQSMRQSKEEETKQEEDDSDLTAHEKKFLNLMRTYSTRKVGLCRTINISREMSSRLNALTTDDDYGTVLIDGGCDTTLCGQGWEIESVSERRVNVQGYADNVESISLPIGTAIAAVELDDQTVIVEANEAILMESNKNSLLSTFQVREFGHKVHDVARRHGGDQCLEADGTKLPFSVVKGLFTMRVRLPTEAEKLDCVRIPLTSDQPWEPEIFSDGSHSDDPLAVTIASSSVLRREVTVADPISQVEVDTTHLYLERVSSVNANSTSDTPIDVSKYQHKLGWMPLSVIKRTLKNTTNLAKNFLRLPLRRHFKSRYPQLNRNRLQETYCTDTFFSSVDGIGGISCMQIFCGEKSLFTKAYSMTTESQGPDKLEEFIADVGAPYKLKSDNSQMQTSEAWRAILRKYNIAFGTTEPQHPWQNKCERRIQDVKSFTNRIMDHTKTPDFLWNYCVNYVIYLMNHTSSRVLGWKTPIEMAFGSTPDISALLQYAFYEPVYYYDHDQSFPHSQELRGRFLGMAENQGDALTYYVLTSSHTVIARSVLRSALTIDQPNLRADDAVIGTTVEGGELSTYGNPNELGIFKPTTLNVPGEDDDAATATTAELTDDDEEEELLALPASTTTTTESSNGSPVLQSTTDITGSRTLPRVDPLDLVGYKFQEVHNEVRREATVKEMTEDGSFVI